MVRLSNIVKEILFKLQDELRCQNILNFQDHGFLVCFLLRFRRLWYQLTLTMRGLGP